MNNYWRIFLTISWFGMCGALAAAIAYPGAKWRAFAICAVVGAAILVREWSAGKLGKNS